MFPYVVRRCSADFLVMINQFTMDEIYLKKLNSLKKSLLASITASRQLWSLLQAFLTLSLFKLVNAAVILAFSSFLALLGVFLVSHSTLSHILLSRGLQSVELSRKMFKRDMVAEIFSQLTLRSPA